MTDEEAELFCLTVGANQAKKHLDKHDPNGYNGHCPICSAQLTLWDGILYCSAVPEHFEIKQQTFEAAWDKYDAGVMTLESLFRVLIGGNIAKGEQDAKVNSGNDPERQEGSGSGPAMEK